MVTTLAAEISAARKRIAREAIDMSIGELSSLYDENELIISPPYQRLFRWEQQQKTRFVESIFLNVPIPPIFVYTRPDGKWELVDGLQRVSTCLEFMRKLRGRETSEPFVCDSTNLVPSLGGTRWPAPDDDPEGDGALPPELQLNFKRARMRLEVLGPDTDAEVRFELFQRLNSGGTALSEQEVRSCIIYSVNIEAFEKLNAAAADPMFLKVARSSARQKDEQYPQELIVRLICFRNVPYDGRTDVHEYLNHAIIQVCSDPTFSWETEIYILKKTFGLLGRVIGEDVFVRHSQWSLGLYEFLSLAASRLVESDTIDDAKLKTRYQELLADPDLVRYTGAGVRGTARWRNFVMARGNDFLTK